MSALSLDVIIRLPYPWWLELEQSLSPTGLHHLGIDEGLHQF